MLKKINRILFRMRAQKYLKETPRDRRFVSYPKAKSVLILFESDYMEKNPNIRRMIGQLQQDGKKVSAWGYVDKKEVITSILPDFRILHHKQTDRFQKPLISYVNELESLEYDLLIDLSVNAVIPLEYIAMYANASCKTGIRKTDLPIYDFVIDIKNQAAISETEESGEQPIDENYVFDQIIFYLKSIQTND
ncbi:MAG: hypothetical protein QM800_11735 [Paludibacter sp.]